ncbi:hypothetical protein Aperf_G00000111133 [Anoplocephala perfoliata]
MQRIHTNLEANVTCGIRARWMRRSKEILPSSLDTCPPPPPPPLPSTIILHTTDCIDHLSNIKHCWNTSSSGPSSEHTSNARKTSSVCISTAIGEGQTLAEMGTVECELKGSARWDEETNGNWLTHWSPPVWSGLGPVCPVPMLPDWEKILGYKPPLLISPDTQICPVSRTSLTPNGAKSTLCLSAAACAREGVRRNRRSLCECLADCLKKKVVRVRRSLKSHFMNEENFVENTVVVEEGVDFQSASTSASCFRTRRKGNGGVWCVQVSMLGICEDGSCRIQLRRKCNYQPFGVQFKKRWQRLYMCGIVKRVEVKWSGEGEFQMKGRVLEVQGVPSEKLDMRGIGELLKGCLVLTVRMRAAGVR